MLFTSRPLAGHFEPLVPLAIARGAAGHAGSRSPPESRTRVGRAKPASMPSAPDPTKGSGTSGRHDFPASSSWWAMPSGTSSSPRIFANLELVPRADDLDPIIDMWQPDVLVHEVAELAAPMVATAHQIAYVDLSYGALIGSSLLRAAGEAAAPHWRARGSRPHPLAGRFATCTSTMRLLRRVTGDRGVPRRGESACDFARRSHTARRSIHPHGSIGSTRASSCT